MLGGSEPDYRVLFENSLDGILFVDGGWRVHAANAAACRMLATTEHEIISRGCDEIRLADGTSLQNALVGNASQKNGHRDFVLMRSNGSEVPVEISCLKSTTNGGGSQSCIVLRDITAQKRIEQALRDSEASLARPQEIANLGSWEWKIGSGELQWSDQQYRIFGVKRGEFRPTPASFSSIVHPDDRAAFHAGLAKALEGEPFGVDLRIVFSDSSVRHVHLQGRVDFDANGDAVRMTGTALDITERRTTEEALRRSEALLESFFARSPAILNIEDEEFRFIKTDAVTPTYFGLNRHTIIGKKVSELVPEFVAEYGPLLRRVIETGEPKLNTEVQTRVPSTGETVHCCNSYFPIELPSGKRGLGVVGVDLTDRKRAECALPKSAAETARRRTEELAKLMDLVPLAVFVSHDPECRFIAGNRVVNEWYETENNANVPAGRSSCEMLNTGRRYFRANQELKPDELPMQVAATTGSEVRNYEFDLELQNRRRITLLGNATPLLDDQGNVRGVLGAYVNITERKHLEKELRHRIEELQTLMDVVPFGIFVAHDPKCEVITANRAGNAMLEAEEGTNISLCPVGYFRDGVEIPAPELPLQMAASGKDVRNYELEVLLPSGARKVLWGYASPLRDSTGRVRGAVAAFQDVTADRQRTLAQVRESEERFRNIAHAAPVIMWVADTHGRVTWINAEATRFSGIAAHENLAERWEQVIHPDDREAVRACHEENAAQRASYQTQHRARRADGEYRHVLSTAVPRYSGNEYVGYLGTTLDITELKRQQEEDVARQKWQSLGTLAGGIAHDFNNLLGGILSQAELALADISDQSPARSAIDAIRAVAIRGAGIVRELMMYAGQDEETPELVNVSRMVQDSQEFLRVVISKHAVLELALAADTPEVRANPGAVRQILINLVTNASDAIDGRDGVIRLSTSRVSVDGSAAGPWSGLKAGDYLHIEVFDTGCGIPEDIQARIFDPFFTTKSKGRGLGLPMVQGIVRRLGGAITIRSTPDRGTSFRILLPTAGGPAPTIIQNGSDASVETARSAATILVVEDEDILRQAVTGMLRKQRYSVLEAADGSSAIKMLRVHAKELSVMLLDVTLPGVSSAEIIIEARRLRPDLRIIVTSAYSEQKVSAMFEGINVQPFLRKPYRVADLMKLLG